MHKEEPLSKRCGKFLRARRRKIGRFLRRGIGYQIWQLSIIAGYSILFLYYLLILLVYPGAKPILDWNMVISIVLADLPVGLILWVAIQRRISKNRRLLDAVEIVEAPTRYSHLEVHHCDEFDDGLYPDLLYYVVNTRTKLAYWVDYEMKELIERRIVRKCDRHRDGDELNRYFDNNHIKIAGDYPQGDDLFLSGD